MKKVLFVGFLAGVCLSAQFAPAAVFAMTKCSKQENTNCNRGCDENGEGGCEEGAPCEEKLPPEVKCTRRGAAQRALEKECDYN